MARRPPALAIAASAALACTAAAPAQARVSAAQVIDGPAAEILELGGVAMAPDGTGGLVYRRTDEGRTHIFVARFAGGHWSERQRVDVGQRFDSAWPRIAAASGGRLVVAWTQDGGEGLDGLYSAVLPRGNSRFLPPTLVDFNIGEDSATHPSLAMSAGGAALVAYRAVRAFTSPLLPTGYVAGDVRVARFDGSRWQRLGVPANRNRATPQRQPTADNAPRIGIDAAGNGAVAWQEPDDDFVDRVWARRIFGTRFGVPLPASPVRLGAAVNGGAADQIGLAVSRLGRVVVGFRQLPDPRDRAGVARLLVNELQESTSEKAASFEGPQAVADSGAAAPAIALGERSDALIAFPRRGSAELAYRPTAGEFALRDAGIALDGPPPVVTAGLDGRSVLASAGLGGGGEVLVRQFSGVRAIEIEPVFAPFGGPVRELAIAGTGLGDALVAFAQGRDDDRQIMTTTVDAPPAPFGLSLAPGWSRAHQPSFTWSPADDALGAVTYTVSIDGRRVARTSETRMQLPEGALDQGAHSVSVVATDALGQRTNASPDRYRLDLQVPLVRITARGRVASVRIDDPGGERASGPRPEGSSVTWGDQDSSDGVTATARHSFTKAGRYRVTVTAADGAGNRVVVQRQVVVTKAAVAKKKKRPAAKRRESIR